MSDQTRPISSLVTEFLDQPPSCLEFCPSEPDYFVLGTYLLQEKREELGDNESEENSAASIKQTKTGTLQLWHLNVNTDNLQQKQVVPLSHAVFDLHFHPRQSEIVGIASSDGTVSLYTVSRHTAPKNEKADPCLEHVWTRSVHEDPSIPALYLAWLPQNWFPVVDSKELHDVDGFAVTFSDGRTSVFSTTTAHEDGNRQHDIVKSNSGMELIESQFESSQDIIETWFVALANYSGQESSSSSLSSFIFTGDDFGSLTTRKFTAPEAEGTDYHDQDEIATLEGYMLSNSNDRSRHHTAGVTAILPLPYVEMIDNAPILLTGSYDEYIRVYHATPRGSVLAEELLGGGVWRLQVIRTDSLKGTAGVTETSGEEIQYLILASCMHAGTRIVKVTWKKQNPGSADIGAWDIQVLAQFTEHESMNYASGVWKGCNSASDLVCVSSSFYDKRLCLWKFQV